MERFTFALHDRARDYLTVYPAARRHLDPALLDQPLAAQSAAPERRQRIAQTCRLPLTPVRADTAQLDIGELIDQVLLGHHRFLFAELGRLETLLGMVRAPPTLCAQVGAWAEDLRRHMVHEEDSLFPLCRALDADGEQPDPDPQLHGMYRSHEDAELMLVPICAEIGDLAGDPILLTVIRRTLGDIITDLHRHLETEDGVLLPAVLFERELRVTSRVRKSQLLRALQRKPAAENAQKG